MGTHELARALVILSKALKKAPNIELGELDLNKTWVTSSSSMDSLAVNLHTLSELSSVDKSQWKALIESYGFPIQIRARDASRDILGKLLKFLEEEPSAKDYLRNRLSHAPGGTSPELMKALASLLK